MSQIPPSPLYTDKYFRQFCRVVLKLLVIIVQNTYRGRYSEPDVQAVNEANRLADILRPL